jgi:hypothetical protein
MDHPRGIQRPYVHVSSEEKARAERQRRKAAKERGFEILMAELRARRIKRERGW